MYHKSDQPVDMEEVRRKRELYFTRQDNLITFFKGMKCFHTQGDLFSLLGSLSNNNGKKAIG